MANTTASTFKAVKILHWNKLRAIFLAFSCALFAPKRGERRMFASVVVSRRLKRRLINKSFMSRPISFHKQQPQAIFSPFADSRIVFCFAIPGKLDGCVTHKRQMNYAFRLGRDIARSTNCIMSNSRVDLWMWKLAMSLWVVKSCSAHSKLSLTTLEISER